MHDHRDCLKFFSRLSEYIDHELDSTLRRVIDAHMEKCAACRVCIVTLKQTVGLCGMQKDISVPGHLSAKLSALLLSETPEP